MNIGRVLQTTGLALDAAGAALVPLNDHVNQNCHRCGAIFWMCRCRRDDEAADG